MSGLSLENNCLQPRQEVLHISRIKRPFASETANGLIDSFARLDSGKGHRLAVQDCVNYCHTLHQPPARCQVSPSTQCSIMRKITIIAEIDAKVGTDYGAWRIGLTQSPYERKQHWSETEKLDVSKWTAWTAESLSDARDIEAHFIAKGMQGGVGGDMASWQTTTVYIF